jgi:3-hydroxyisobutyrate dehydrogenase-like beta-hydroxyacid dehydrogenase
MANDTIAILHPGEMGAAIGARLRAEGLRVVWAGAGRSTATRARATAAGLADAGTLRDALSGSHLVLSVCPPHAAVALAQEVAAAGYRGVYVDANAIAPATACEIARIVEASGASFVDGGIIGPPPRDGVGARLYLSGGDAARLAGLLSSGELVAAALDGGVGAASALKAAYAAWNKGATALAAAAYALAVHAGVADALMQEWRGTQPDAVKRLDSLQHAARKAWRWIGEMEEIAAAHAAAELPDGFHLAVAELYGRLASFKDAGAPPPLAELIAALGATGTAAAAPAAPFLLGREKGRG